ncbi:2759_t:CDS:1, partial [Gigaspora rosea]
SDNSYNIGGNKESTPRRFQNDAPTTQLHRKEERNGKQKKLPT